MRAHSVVASQVIEGMSSLQAAAPIVRSHHERWDGAGYTDGLAGAAIPVAARTLGVVDALDAMTVARPHRAAVTRRAALNELRRCAGTHLDPDVVTAAERVLGGRPHLRSVA